MCYLPSESSHVADRKPRIPVPNQGRSHRGQHRRWESRFGDAARDLAADARVAAKRSTGVVTGPDSGPFTNRPVAETSLNISRSRPAAGARTPADFANRLEPRNSRRISISHDRHRRQPKPSTKRVCETRLHREESRSLFTRDAIAPTDPIQPANYVCETPRALARPFQMILLLAAFLLSIKRDADEPLFTGITTCNRCIVTLRFHTDDAA